MDLSNVTRPITFFQSDPSLPDTLNLGGAANLNSTAQQLAARGIPANVTYYPGEAHGFVLGHSQLYGINETAPVEQRLADATAAYEAGEDWLNTNLNITAT